VSQNSIWVDRPEFPYVITVMKNTFQYKKS